MDAVDDVTYAALADHFGTQEIIELCFTVGLSNFVNRFHATFLTDLDPWARDALGAACPLSFPEAGHDAGRNTSPS
jgi:hypothetical protein